MIDWKDEYSVGDAAIDAQHRRLLAMCSQCEELAARNDVATNESFHILLHDLSEYARVHFDYEEALLRRYGYSKLPEHVEEHERYWEQLTEILLKASLGQDEKDDVRQLLKQWWLNHIQGVDMEYSNCITGRG